MDEQIEDKINIVKVLWVICQIDSRKVVHTMSDIKAGNMQDILYDYGIYQNWTKREIQLLKRHLLDMASKGEKSVKSEYRKHKSSDDSLDYAIISLYTTPRKRESLPTYETSTSKQGLYVKTGRNQNGMQYHQLDKILLNKYSVRNKMRLLKPLENECYVGYSRRY